MNTMMFRAVGLAVLLCAAPMAHAQTVDQIDAARAEAAQLTDAEIIGLFRQGMEEVNPGQYAVLRENFPQEVGAFEKKVIAEARAGRLHSGTADKLGFDFIQGIFFKYRPAMAKAPAPIMAEAMAAQRDAMRMLQQVNVVACYEMGERGTLSLNSAISLSDKARAEMMKLGRVQLKVLIAGMRTPVKRGIATRTDLAAIAAAYEKRGGSLEVLGAAGTPGVAAFSPAERCAAVVVLAEALADQEPEVLARYWAYTLNPTEEPPEVASSSPLAGPLAGGA